MVGLLHPNTARFYARQITLDSERDFDKLLLDLGHNHPSGIPIPLPVMPATVDGFGLGVVSTPQNHLWRSTFNVYNDTTTRGKRSVTSGPLVVGTGPFAGASIQLYTKPGGVTRTMVQQLELTNVGAAATQVRLRDGVVDGGATFYFGSLPINGRIAFGGAPIPFGQLANGIRFDAGDQTATAALIGTILVSEVTDTAPVP